MKFFSFSLAFVIYWFTLDFMEKRLCLSLKDCLLILTLNYIICTILICGVAL